MLNFSEIKHFPKYRIHKYILCDYCNSSKEIYSNFYRCQEKCNFDICADCYKYAKSIKEKLETSNNSNPKQEKPQIKIQHNNNEKQDLKKQVHQGYNNQNVSSFNKINQNKKNNDLVYDYEHPLPQNNFKTN